MKPVTPVVGNDHSYVLIIFNTNVSPQPANITVTLKDWGLNHTDGYGVQVNIIWILQMKIGLEPAKITTCCKI